MPSYAGDSTTWDQVKDKPSEIWTSIKENVGMITNKIKDFFGLK